ncbi:hypothetical protein FOXYSP1_19494 [Fusarium oxysporum f. sp. phaseoli]
MTGVPEVNSNSDRNPEIKVCAKLPCPTSNGPVASSNCMTSVHARLSILIALPPHVASDPAEGSNETFKPQHTTSLSVLVQTINSMGPRVIPEPGNVPSVSQDAQQAYWALQSGGVIIAPTDVGYALMTSTQDGVQRIFAAKGRQQGHNIGIIGTYQQHRQMHILPESKFELTRVLTEDMGMIVGIIAKYNSKNLHPRLAALDNNTLSQVTKGDTISIAVAEGPFLRELGRLCDDDPQGMLMFGTSANVTGQGQRFRIEDVEPAVLACADLVVDYGLQKWHMYDRGGVNFDAEKMQVLRMGAGYEVFRDRILRWFPQLLEEAGGSLEEDPEHGVGLPRPPTRTG